MLKENKINIRQTKGTWWRFIKLLFKVNLPLVSVAIFVLSEIYLVNIGVSETEYTAKLFAGDVSAELILSLVVVILINLGAGALSALIRQITSARIDRNTRRAIWNKLLHIPMDFFKEDNPQETINRIVGNAVRVSSTITTVIVPVATSGYAMALSVLKVYKYDMRLAWTLLLSVPLAILVAFITGRLKYSASKASANVGALLTEQLSELITNIPLAKAFAREKYEEERADKITKEQYRISVKTGWIGQVSDLAFNLLSIIQTIAVVLVGWLLVRDEQIPKVVWTTFFLFSNIVMSNISSLVIYWHNVKNIQGVIDRVATIMDYKIENQDGEPAGDLHGSIEVKDVTFGYNEDKTVLDGISCTFRQGKVTALLGPSGCGKTTLVNMIDRIYLPVSGEITIGGRNVQEYALSSYRSRFAVISQNPMLFSGSIRQNLTFGVQGERTEEAMWQALEQVGLAEFVRELPDTWETDIGEQGNRLSGGQKQKLALARLLLQDAPYVLLDEATASMDLLAVQELKAVLQKVLPGRTTILIAHSPQLMDLVDNVVVIEDGHITADGPLAEAADNHAFLTHFMKGDEAHEG